jgi:hypothetical protein
VTYREMFEAELAAHDIAWCQGCERYNSHRRGFASQDRTIHFESKIGTRSTLYGGLHEVGHIVRDHFGKGRRRRWQEEQEAERYARTRMRELGVPIPRKDVQAGDAYVARMKRWGDRIAAGRR